jgi:hypothetical protein
MILGNSRGLCIKLVRTTLRPIALTATAGSLEGAERAIILQAVESRIKKLGLVQKRKRGANSRHDAYLALQGNNFPKFNSGPAEPPSRLPRFLTIC